MGIRSLTAGIGPGHNHGPPLVIERQRARPGRPSKSRPELRECILDRLTFGEPIRRICKAPGMPTPETIRYWRRTDAIFSRQFDAAQKLGWQYLADDLFSRVREALDQGDTTGAKLLFDTGRRYLARQAPKYFGGDGRR